MRRITHVLITIALVQGVVLVAPAGAAPATCKGLAATKTGTSVRDEIHGTEHRDVIVAGDGADTVFGLGGDDVICGGLGRDTIEGGAGDDILAG